MSHEQNTINYFKLSANPKSSLFTVNYNTPIRSGPSTMYTNDYHVHSLQDGVSVGYYSHKQEKTELPINLICALKVASDRLYVCIPPEKAGFDPISDIVPILEVDIEKLLMYRADRVTLAPALYWLVKECADYLLNHYPRHKSLGQNDVVGLYDHLVKRFTETKGFYELGPSLDVKTYVKDRNDQQVVNSSRMPVLPDAADIDPKYLFAESVELPEPVNKDEMEEEKPYVQINEELLPVNDIKKAIERHHALTDTLVEVFPTPAPVEEEEEETPARVTFKYSETDEQIMVDVHVKEEDEQLMINRARLDSTISATAKLAKNVIANGIGYENASAIEIAASALSIISDRAQTYDKANKAERSFEKCAVAFNAITGHTLTPAEVALLLQLLKDVRQWSSPSVHLDSALDSINYSALKAEAILKEGDDKRSVYRQ